MANYTGMITAVYVNVSKKGKEYSTGYIRLPDASGNESSYKFLVFKDEEVEKIKNFGPENLKGKTITVDGEFKENTWNGRTEYQLFANSVTLPEETPSAAGAAPVPGTPTTTESPSNPQSESQIQTQPSGAGSIEETSVPQPGIPEVPSVPNVPGI